MVTLKSILLVEDDPKDIDLTLGSLEEYNLEFTDAVKEPGIFRAVLNEPPPGCVKKTT